jgi:hypothetical protein
VLIVRDVWAGAVIATEGFGIPVLAEGLIASTGVVTLVPSKVKLEDPAAILLPSL